MWRDLLLYRTLWRLIKRWFNLRVIIPIKGLRFCLRYYTDKNGAVKNAETDGIYWTHKESGLLKYNMKNPCCDRFCSPHECTYNATRFPLWLKLFLKFKRES